MFTSQIRLQEAGLVAVIVLLGLLLTFAGGEISSGGRMVNNFLRVEYLVPSVFTSMAWIAIPALGATIVIASGGIDISVGSIIGLSALSAAAAMEQMGFAEDASAWQVLPIAVVVPLAVGLICGLINGALVVGLRMHPFIVTLGTLSIFRGIALIAVPMKSLPTPDYALPNAFARDFVGLQVFWSRPDGPPLMLQPVPLIIMLVCGAAAWIFLAHTVSGRRVVAVGGNEEAARFAGISVGRVKLLVYVLSGLSAGVTGMALCGFNGSANTATGEGYELMVIAAAVVGGASLTGGRGTALGALLGALVIKLIENGTFILKSVNLGFVVFPVSREYTKIIVGVAIILAVAVDRLSEYLQNRRSARR